MLKKFQRKLYKAVKRASAFQKISCHGIGAAGQNVYVRVMTVLHPHTAEIPVSAKHCPCIFEVKRQHEFSPRHCVIQSADKQSASTARVRQILVQQQQIVAIIEICLARV